MGLKLSLAMAAIASSAVALSSQAAVTYSTTTAATGSTFAGTGISGTPQQLTSAPNASGASNQAFVNVAGVLAETFTPSSSYTLTGFAVNNGGQANNTVNLGLYDVTSTITSNNGTVQNGSGATYPAPSPNLFSAGLSITTTANALSEGDFALSGVDQVTLTAGHIYALEFSLGGTPNNGTSSYVLQRNNGADAGGQGMATSGTATANRLTLTSAGAAGGAPRTFEIQFYGTTSSTPEPTALGVMGLGAVLGLRRKRA